MNAPPLALSDFSTTQARVLLFCNGKRFMIVFPLALFLRGISYVSART